MKGETVTPVSNIDYNYVGDNSKKNSKCKNCKKIFMPNSKIITGFILVLIIVGIITLMTFPFSSFISGNMDIKVRIGTPLTFAELQLSGENTVIMTVNLIIDLVIYTIGAYLINVILNFLSGIKLFKKKIEAEEIPTIFKNQEITPPEKLAEKITGEN